jgi:hypothetical protein
VCIAAVAGSATRSRRIPCVRSATTTKSRKASTLSTNAVSRCGSQSRQFAGDGSAAGARTTLKLRAPSALVRIRKASPAGSTSYSTPARRGATTRGASAGRAVGIVRHSDVVKLCVGISTCRPSRDRYTDTL